MSGRRSAGVEKLQHGPAEQGEAGGVVGFAIDAPAAELVVARLGIDEEAIDPVHPPLLDVARDQGTAEGDLQIADDGFESLDEVEAQAVVLG